MEIRLIGCKHSSDLASTKVLLGMLDNVLPLKDVNKVHLKG